MTFSRKIGKLAFVLLSDLMQTELTFQLILNVFNVFLLLSKPIYVNMGKFANVALNLSTTLCLQFNLFKSGVCLAI